jgi:hypothetical protein
MPCDGQEEQTAQLTQWARRCRRFCGKKGGSPAFVLLRDAAFEDMKPCINDPSRKNEHHLAEQDGYVAEPAEVWLVE